MAKKMGYPQPAPGAQETAKLYPKKGLGLTKAKGKDKGNTAVPPGAPEGAELYMLPMSKELRDDIKSHVQYQFPEEPYDSQTLLYHADVKHWGDR
jgi:hypothetical protein